MTQGAGIGVSVTTTHETAQFALGEIVWQFGKAYLYVQASGAITGDGYVVTIDETFQAAALTTSNDAEGDKVGVVEAAFADNEYGWAQVYGACGIRTEQEALANSFLGATSDAGQVDDAAATGLYISGMNLGTATGGADAVNTTGFLNWPVITVRMEPEA